MTTLPGSHKKQILYYFSLTPFLRIDFKEHKFMGFAYAFIRIKENLEK